jgi:hypothetical protein
MARTVALAFALFVLTAADAQATAFRVVVVPGLGLDDLPALAQRGAVGVLVPGSGPETSGAAARAALVRGKVTNSLSGRTTGPALIGFETSSTIPAGPVIVLGLPSGPTQSNDRRYAVAVLGGGYKGLLVSDSTRIPGLVSIVDIAPTALGQSRGLTWEGEANAAQHANDLDRRIAANNRYRIPATLLILVLITGLAVVWPWAGLLAFGAALVANLLLGLAGVWNPWALLTILGLGTVLGGMALGVALRSDFAAGAFFALVLGAYLVALGAGSAVALSILGPTQNGRFFGVGNLLETILLVPALGGVFFLARRFGPAGFAVVALLSFLMVAGNRFGADGGGAIVLAAGFAVLGALFWGARGRMLVVVFAGAVGLAIALLALDAATGASSHVTRALDSGPGGLASDLRDRVTLSWHRIEDKPAVAIMFGIGVVALVALTVHTLRSDRPLADRALPLGFAAAIAVSLIVNDSPNDVAIAGSVGLLVCDLVMLPRRWAAASCSRSPLALSWPVVAERPLSRPPPRP